MAMAMGKKAGAGKPPRQRRGAQIRAMYTMAKRVDPKIGLIVALTGLGVFLAFLLVGFLVGHPIYLALLGLPLALTAMAVVFGRRTQRAAFTQLEGQTGAAASVLQSMRGFLVTPGVAVTRNADIVHRAVGRPGILLVGEGAPTRLGNLIAQEKKRLGRIVPDVPVYDLQAGTGEGQVPIAKLQRTVLKLPRNLRQQQVNDVERRLKALGNAPVPLPKGPLPRNARLPRPPRGPRS